MISIVYNPSCYADFERAVRFLDERGGAAKPIAVTEPKKNGVKGPKELEYQNVFGKNLRLTRADMESGKDRETIAAERLDLGKDGDEGEEITLARASDIDANDPYA